MFRDAGGRLAMALVLSALIHAWLVGGVRLGRVQTSAISPLSIEARLESGDLLPSAEETPSAPDHQVSSPGLLASSPALAPGSGTALEPASLHSAYAAQATDEFAQVPDQYDPRPPLDAPLVVDATVYAPHELDVIPLPLEPVTPPVAREAASAVSITLELVVDEHGNVREGRVVEVDPPHYPADAALQAFRASRFSPAEREGRAVRARIAIKLEYAGGEVPQRVSP